MRLNACLAIALPLTGLAATPLPAAGTYSFTKPGLHAFGRPLLAAAMPRGPARLTQHVATTRLVSNCGNSGDGSLRAAANIATDFDVIDMSGLACSMITLTTGQIVLGANNVTLQGPKDHRLYIDALQASRVIRHTGIGILNIYDLGVNEGRYAPYNSPGGVSKGACVYSSGAVNVARSSFNACKLYAPLNNPTLAAGGAIAAEGYVRLQHSVIEFSFSQSAGSPALGGGIFSSTDVYLTDSSVSDASVDSSTFAVYGGGVYAYGNAFIERSTVHYCGAQAFYNFAGPGYGGGVFVAGTLSNLSGTTITRSTISRNYSRNVAGVEIVHGIGSLFTATITDSTISGNVASNRSGGMVSTMPLYVRNSTIAFNNAGTDTTAAGLQVYNNTVDLQSTIIAHNYSPGLRNDFSGANTTVTGSNNLIMLSPASVTPGGTLTADPQLNALANNGGPTRTHALKPGSPAIGQGNNVGGGPFDQRGPPFLRVVDGSVDIGAVEYNTDIVFFDGFEQPFGF